MKIYQNTEIVNEDKLRPGTIGYPFKIEYATILENAYDDKDSLGIELIRKDGKVYGAHWIVGKDLYREFLKDIEVEESNIERLVGREVIGFIHDSAPVMQGVKVK